MASEGSEHEMCWICLEEESESGDQSLVSPCMCPRKVHPQCLARWQLQQAGKHEEKFCRFCNSTLADWKHNLTPEELKPEVSKVQPIMVVYFEGQIHRIPVKQGEDGLSEFTTKIRELFRLPEDVDISLTFGCKEPMSGQHLKLEGMGAFDAAVHCASVAAADRQSKVKKSASTGNLGNTGGSNGASGHPAHPAVVNRSTSSGALSSMVGTSSGSPQQPPHEERRRRVRDETTSPAVRSRSFQASSARPASPTPPLPPGPPASFRSILGSISPSPPAAHTAAGAEMGLPLTPNPGPRRHTTATGPVIADEQLTVAPSARSFAAPAASSPAVAAARASLRKERYSSRAVQQLTDVPEADETVAVGSLSGKFKLTLKAFSRKVARSLSFTAKYGGAADGAAGCSGSTSAAGPCDGAPSPPALLPPLSPMSDASGSSFTIPAGPVSPSCSLGARRDGRHPGSAEVAVGTRPDSPTLPPTSPAPMLPAQLL